MSIGLIGRKCGMTRVFCEDGSSVPVTVLQIDSNRVTQVKSMKLMVIAQSRWLRAIKNLQE